MLALRRWRTGGGARPLLVALLLVTCVAAQPPGDGCRWRLALRPAPAPVTELPQNCSLVEVLLSQTPNRGGGAKRAALSDSHGGGGGVRDDAQHLQRGALLAVVHDASLVAPPGALFWESLLIKALYCRLHGNTLYLYVGRAGDLPQGLLNHFHKVRAIEAALRVGHPWVFYSDMDTFFLPPTAVAVESLLRPGAALTLQAESNLCTCVLVFANVPASFAFLRAWWDFGVESRCCAQHTFDQIAFKHVLGRMLQEHTDTDLGVPGWALHAEPSSQTLFHTIRAPFVHFYGGEDASQPTPRTNWSEAAGGVWAARALPRVQLHSCLVQWAGCVAGDAPALVYHTGHGGWVDGVSDVMSRDAQAQILDWWVDAAGMRPGAQMVRRGAAAAEAIASAEALLASPLAAASLGA